MEYMRYYVYILKSVKDQSLYTGCTSNLKRRIEEHNDGSSPFTKYRGPFNLVWFSSFEDKAKAFAFEKYLKSGSGRAFSKKHLI